MHIPINKTCKKTVSRLQNGETFVKTMHAYVRKDADRVSVFAPYYENRVVDASTAAACGLRCGSPLTPLQLNCFLSERPTALEGEGSCDVIVNGQTLQNFPSVQDVVCVLPKGCASVNVRCHKATAVYTVHSICDVTFVETFESVSKENVSRFAYLPKIPAEHFEYASSRVLPLSVDAQLPNATEVFALCAWRRMGDREECARMYIVLHRGLGAYDTIYLRADDHDNLRRCINSATSVGTLRGEHLTAFAVSKALSFKLETDQFNFFAVPKVAHVVKGTENVKVEDRLEDIEGPPGPHVPLPFVTHMKIKDDRVYECVLQSCSHVVDPESEQQFSRFVRFKKRPRNLAESAKTHLVPMLLVTGADGVRIWGIWTLSSQFAASNECVIRTQSDSYVVRSECVGTLFNANVESFYDITHAKKLGKTGAWAHEKNAEPQTPEETWPGYRPDASFARLTTTPGLQVAHWCARQANGTQYRRSVCTAATALLIALDVRNNACAFLCSVQDSTRREYTPSALLAAADIFFPFDNVWQRFVNHATGEIKPLSELASAYLVMAATAAAVPAAVLAKEVLTVVPKTLNDVVALEQQVATLEAQVAAAKTTPAAVVDCELMKKKLLKVAKELRNASYAASTNGMEAVVRYQQYVAIMQTLHPETPHPAAPAVETYEIPEDCKQNALAAAFP